MGNESKAPPNAAPTEPDERELAGITGGKTFTGGRFQLDISAYSVGYLRPSPQAPGGQETAPAVPPPH